MSNNISDLIVAARHARDRAYAPYSGFAVGAALLTKSGRVFIGNNVENISFGLTMCAERVCVGAAVAAGERDFTQLIIATRSNQSTMPCGACRQVIAEFNPSLKISSVAMDGSIEEVTMDDLLPRAHYGIDVPRRT
jgi:cytidine deaminase